MRCTSLLRGLALAIYYTMQRSSQQDANKLCLQLSRYGLSQPSGLHVREVCVVRLVRVWSSNSSS